MNSLLSGNEVQLEEGAFGDLSRQILRLFTEAKRTHSEQSEELENIPIVSFHKIKKKRKTFKKCYKKQNVCYRSNRHYQIRLKKSSLYVFVVKPLMLLASVVRSFYGKSNDWIENVQSFNL